MKTTELNWDATVRLRRAVEGEIKSLEQELKNTTGVSVLKDQEKSADYWTRRMSEIRTAIDQLRAIEFSA